MAILYLTANYFKLRIELLKNKLRLAKFDIVILSFLIFLSKFAILSIIIQLVFLVSVQI